MTSTTARRAAATAKSTNWAITEATGKTSRARYTLVTRSRLVTRLLVANRIEDTKNAQGTAFTLTFAMSALLSGWPDTVANAYLTTIPAITISAGIRIAQRNPITDCLYFTAISRHTRM